MKNNIYKYIIAAIAVLIILNGTIFIVDQRSQALVVQFGEVVRIINKPGLKLKIPLVQDVIRFDKRILDLGISDQEVIAADQKRLIINAFTKYKIIDPLKFYTTVRTSAVAKNKLSAILDSNLREAIGEVPLIDLLSENRAKIMARIQESFSKEVEIFGIEIVDVRIMRGDLPKENSDAIFTRMQTAREKEAKEIRAKGAEEAERIKAEADKQRTVILAEAKKEANITRGSGDGEAAKISSAAFSKDPAFYDFYRSMQAYDESLRPEKTTIIISPDSEFFKYFDKVSSN
ncbi:MAG: hflC [Rickettsiaceae bacterium]|jgi:membrane protease subunit HflC|nr:hflC [Rickettsiaceae bacterium]